MEEMMIWIGKEICHTYADRLDSPTLSEESLERLYRMSKAHDLAHVVGSALFRRGLLPNGAVWTEKFKKQMMLATFRYEQSRLALSEICAVLEEAEVPFIPLKGAILRDWYPEPWMRTSCDLDILVHREDLERASVCLEQKLSYRRGEWNAHDLSLFSPDGSHLELHYDLVEDGVAQRAQSVLSEVWDDAVAREGSIYCHKMTDAMFYFYHIAHMAKHFEIGGCGVRPFLDLWILDHCVEHSSEKREALLEQGGLATFARVCQDVCEAWLSGKEPSELTRRAQHYVLSGGVYGSDENRISVQQGKRGGRFSYAVSKIFLPYDELKFHYPVLIRHRWLLPVMEARRWGKLIFCGGVRRSVRELKTNQSVTKDKSAQAKEFIRQVGL